MVCFSERNFATLWNLKYVTNIILGKCENIDYIDSFMNNEFKLHVTHAGLSSAHNTTRRQDWKIVVAILQTPKNSCVIISCRDPKRRMSVSKNKSAFTQSRLRISPFKIAHFRTRNYAFVHQKLRMSSYKIGHVSV